MTGSTNQAAENERPEPFSPIEYLEEHRHLPLREILAALVVQKQQVQDMLGQALLDEFGQYVEFGEQSRLPGDLGGLRESIAEMEALRAQVEEIASEARESSELFERYAAERRRAVSDTQTLDHMLELSALFDRMRGVLQRDSPWLSRESFCSDLVRFKQMLSEAYHCPFTDRFKREVEKLDRIANNMASRRVEPKAESK